MNLEKLRKLYNENPILKVAFEDTFSKYELGLTENKLIVSQDEFNKDFNEILKGSTQRYLDPDTDFTNVSKNKTTRIEVLDKNNEWLIDYDTNKENPHFWYSYGRVYSILRERFSLEKNEIQSLMKSLVETQYKMKDTQPLILNYYHQQVVETQYKMKDTQPRGL